jgi:hypothetical protein
MLSIRIQTVFSLFPAAATLLVSLVPSQPFRQGYRSTKFYGGHHTVRDVVQLSPEAQSVLHQVRYNQFNSRKHDS